MEDAKRVYASFISFKSSRAYGEFNKSLFICFLTFLFFFKFLTNFLKKNKLFLFIQLFILLFNYFNKSFFFLVNFKI